MFYINEQCASHPPSFSIWLFVIFKSLCVASVGAAKFNVDNLLGRSDTQNLRHCLTNHNIVFNPNTDALIFLGVGGVSWNIKTGF